MKSGIFVLSIIALVALAKANIVIESPHETNWGAWHSWSRCRFGTYAQALQVKTEPYQGAGSYDDDTATNGIRFYCGNPYNASTPYISSGVQEWGAWGNIYACRSDDRPVAPDGYITGFQLRVEPTLPIGDDTATNNVRIFCSYPSLGISEQMKEADGLNFGSWTSERKCNSNQAICAVQTQLEAYQGDSDDTAMNNIRAECCDR